MDVPAITSTILPPPTGETANQNLDRRILAKAAAAISQSGIWPGRTLKIHLDMATQKLTLRVVNSQTSEIVDQIPSDNVLRMASEIAASPKISNNSVSTKL
jgi:uncharacterized FlaG/YvyC family protein